MVHDSQVKSARIFHRSPHNPSSRHWPAIVRNCHDTRLLHLANFGKLFTFRPLGQRTNRENIRELRSFGLFNDETSDGGTIVDGIGVRHRADRGPTARHCCRRS